MPPYLTHTKKKKYGTCGMSYTRDVAVYLGYHGTQKKSSRGHHTASQNHANRHRINLCVASEARRTHPSWARLTFNTTASVTSSRRTSNWWDALRNRRSRRLRHRTTGRFPSAVGVDKAGDYECSCNRTSKLLPLPNQRLTHAICTYFCLEYWYKIS